MMIEVFSKKAVGIVALLRLTAPYIFGIQIAYYSFHS